MHKVLIFACCAVSVSFAASNHSNISETVNSRLIKNGTLYKTLFQKAVSAFKNKSDEFKQRNISNTHINLKLHVTVKPENSSTVEHEKSRKEIQNMPILRKIHARITRSKDAVWATITLTFICVLLVLAVAQSRMWKDHYYREAQGVPLPNFNERVLFKDVMERKVKSLKQFFKQRSKEKEPNETELESLLPPSEWD